MEDWSIPKYWMPGSVHLALSIISAPPSKTWCTLGTEMLRYSRSNFFAPSHLPFLIFWLCRPSHAWVKIIYIYINYTQLAFEFSFSSSDSMLSFVNSCLISSSSLFSSFISSSASDAAFRPLRPLPLPLPFPRPLPRPPLAGLSSVLPTSDSLAALRSFAWACAEHIFLYHDIGG